MHRVSPTAVQVLAFLASQNHTHALVTSFHSRLLAVPSSPFSFHDWRMSVFLFWVCLHVCVQMIDMRACVVLGACEARYLAWLLGAIMILN